MKLTEEKKRNIDSYFDNHSAEYVYQRLKSYGLPEDVDVRALSYNDFMKCMNKSRYERIITKLNLSVEQREIFESLSNHELFIICRKLWKKENL